ncbi:MAG: hypothetical protein JSS79_21235 [Bacteroidetes bacterium]|nr:hypothetical protein [Bacteroidota bacterium]
MKLLRPILSVTLASVMLASSIGVTINMHICGGHIQSTALFLKANSCGDMPMDCSSSSPKMKSGGCCQEKSIVVKGKETSAEVQAAVQWYPSFEFVATLLPVLYTFVNTPAKEVPAFAHYKPPLPDRDIPVLTRSFLI